MGAHQRVRVEVAVERRDLARGDGAGKVARDAPVAGIEIADREGGELARHQPGQARHAMAGEGSVRCRPLGDGAQHVQRPTQIRPSECLHHGRTSNGIYLPVGKRLVN
jgi:hypothetical protein